MQSDIDKVPPPCHAIQRCVCSEWFRFMRRLREATSASLAQPDAASWACCIGESCAPFLCQLNDPASLLLGASNLVLTCEAVSDRFLAYCFGRLANLQSVHIRCCLMEVPSLTPDPVFSHINTVLILIGYPDCYCQLGIFLLPDRAARLADP